MTIIWAMIPAFLGFSRSTRIPMIGRSMAPASTGTATIRPFCAALRCRWALAAGGADNAAALMIDIVALPAANLRIFGAEDPGRDSLRYLGASQQP
jgi:hypothetical protein